MLVRLTNVYPCYYAGVSLYPKNLGTIPIHIARVKVGDNDWITQNAYYKLDLSGDGKPDIELKWGDNFGAQLHGDTPPPELSCEIHVLQTAEQGGEWSFPILIEAAQYNEELPQD